MQTTDSKTTRIVAAILDTMELKLYTQGGDTISIPQGDPRVQRIINEVTTPLSTQGWADIHIEEPAPVASAYTDFEEQTTGVVKFFRVAKRFLKGVFSTGETETGSQGSNGTYQYVAPVSLGTVPTEAELVEHTPAARTLKQATDEIMAQAVPLKSDQGTTMRVPDDDPEHTIVAQVQNQEGEISIVPGMEHLKNQFQHAAKLGSTEGVTNFLRRLAAVIPNRGHTIDELLQFMSRGDLPIADDGSIVGYKVLQSRTEGHNRYFVDCHTKNVKQKIGSFVHQKHVDPSRRTECSTGLHIARRQYLRGFNGDVICLVKINPEDVIAVPVGDPDKMRAQGYHILFEIPADEHSRLRSNQPLESTEAKQLLGLALRGKHGPILEDVTIGGNSGSNVVVTPRVTNDQSEVKQLVEVAPAEPIVPAEEPKPQDLAPVVAPTSVSKQVAETKAAQSVAAPVTVQRQMYNDERYAELAALKKSKKKSWTLLGFTDAEVATITGTREEKPGSMSQQEVAKQEEMVSAIAPIAEQITEADEGVPATETRGEKARRLYNDLNWVELYAHKKASKVGWDRLGFSDYQIDEINRHAPK